MLIKALNDVTTTKEKRVLKDVRWGFLSQKSWEKPLLPREQKGMITGIWRSGCSLLTRMPLVQGERIWLRAKDSLGNFVISQVGVVVWNENRYSSEGSRCEVRFSEA